MSAKILVAALIAAVCLASVHSAISVKIFSLEYDPEASPTEARNLRAKVRYHWALANKAQKHMLEAVRVDDVDEYEKWLEVMHEEDERWQELASEYEQIREMLEARIRTDALKIEGFEERHVKGTLSSIVDHLTFSVKSK